MRRYGSPSRPGPLRLRPGVYAAIRLGGGILLTLQADGTASPELQLPGGGVDPGEQPLAALHREVLEETGWRIAGPRRLGAFRAFVEIAPAAFAGASALPGGPGASLGRERLWARTRRGTAAASGGEIPAEKVCVVYAARATRRLGPPSEPGHAAAVLTPDDATAALGPLGAGAILRRALAAGLV